MPKGQSGQKLPKFKKLPRKLPEDSVARCSAIVQEATEREVGDVADKITRAPKNKR